MGLRTEVVSRQRDPILFEVSGPEHGPKSWRAKPGFLVDTLNDRLHLEDRSEQDALRHWIAEALLPFWQALLLISRGRALRGFLQLRHLLLAANRLAAYSDEIAYKARQSGEEPSWGDAKLSFLDDDLSPVFRGLNRNESAEVRYRIRSHDAELQKTSVEGMRLTAGLPDPIRLRLAHLEMAGLEGVLGVRLALRRLRRGGR